MRLKFFLLSVSFIHLICQASLAQRSEVGFGLGTFNYTGDMARSYNFALSKPAATVFYRSNLSRVISFRAAFTGGKLAASDKKPVDAFASKRNASFNISLLEASTTWEYHFLNWRENKRILRFTPYLFAGFGVFAMSGTANKPKEYSNVQASIPFGLGIKYVLNPKWYVSLEFGARKTFFDYLDNVSSNESRKKTFQYGNPSDNDNYYFFGFSLTRTFYTIQCPSNPY